MRKMRCRSLSRYIQRKKWSCQPRRGSGATGHPPFSPAYAAQPEVPRSFRQKQIAGSEVPLGDGRILVLDDS